MLYSPHCLAEQTRISMVPQRRLSLMATPQSLTTTQQQTLAAIESVKGRIEAYLPSCPVGSAAPVMSQWINGLDQYVWEFQQVAPMASWLSRQGLPQAEQRLTTLLNDLRSA